MTRVCHRNGFLMMIMKYPGIVLWSELSSEIGHNNAIIMIRDNNMVEAQLKSILSANHLVYFCFEFRGFIGFCNHCAESVFFEI